MQPNANNPIANIVIRVANEYRIFKAGWESDYLFRAHTAIKREHNYLEDIVMNALKKGLSHYEVMSLLDSRFQRFVEPFKRCFCKVEPLRKEHHKFIEEYSIDLCFVDTLASELIAESAERYLK